MRKLKVKKPYKSLEDIYLKESFAKLVPLLPRHLVLGEDSGMAEILIQKDQGEQLPIYKVPNKVADQILKTIKRNEVTQNEPGAQSVNNIIAKCLEMDGWAAQGSGQESSVFSEVVRAFELVDLKYENFKQLEALQRDKNNPVRNILLKNPAVHSPNELLSDKFQALFATPSGALEVLTSLWRIQPQSDANVGPGELALTLISDAVKGKEGDLEFDFGHVEVKGNNAALGSGKVAVNATYEELNKILSAKAGGASIQSTNIEKQKAAILNSIQGYINDYTKHVNNSEKYPPQDAKLHVDIKTKLKNLLERAREAKNFQELVNDVKNSGLPATKKVRTKEGGIREERGEKTRLLDQIELLRRIEAGEVTSTAGGEQSKFNPAVNAFFSNPRITVADRIEGIKHVRSSDRTNQEQIAEVAASLLKTYPKLLSWETGTSYSDLNRFIGAIHVAEYQQEKKFKYLVFFNKDAKDKAALPTKIVSLGFAGTGNTFKEDVVRVFEFFKRKDVNASVKLGVDNTRGTVRVAIT